MRLNIPTKMYAEPLQRYQIIKKFLKSYIFYLVIILEIVSAAAL